MLHPSGPEQDSGGNGENYMPEEPEAGEKITITTLDGPVSEITFMETLGLSDATLIEGQAKELDTFGLIFNNNDNATLSYEVKGVNIYVDATLLSGNPIGTLSNGHTVYCTENQGYDSVSYLYVWEQDGLYVYYGDPSKNRIMTIEEIQSIVDSISITVRYTELEPVGVEQVVTIDEANSLIKDVTFGAPLNVERADCLQAREDMVQVDFKVTNEEIDRTVMFQQHSYETGENTLGTTSDGIEITYTYLSDVSSYQYYWTQNEVSVYMLCKLEPNIETIEKFINNFSFTANSRY